VFEADMPIERGKIVKEEELEEGKPFKRYLLDVPDGISPRGFPGMKGGQYYNNGYEHDETGHMTEDPHLRVAMAAKRLKKYEAMKVDMIAPTVHGDDEAEITFVTWGSMTGPVLEAMDMLRGTGKKVKVIQYTWIYPFPEEKSMELLTKNSRYILVEQNATGQLGGIIREHTSIELKEKMLKNDGRPYYPEEIIAKL
jgi:pyruvate/2-oxoacid:ferredoxin oxidoreductase alpha subunit